MAETAAATNTFRVGKYRCTFTVQQPQAGGIVNMVAEWTPRMPHRLTRSMAREYRAGRDALLSKLAAERNTRALVIEI